jgi:chemotaxis protein methyltransferase CheR
LRDASFLEKIIREFSVTVTDMFRDPFVYRNIRKQVVPMLKTYPYIKVWVAGCATGKEAYSIAILLMEEGLYDRAVIYGTDFNDLALEQSQKGIYSLQRMEAFCANYEQAGGTAALTDYFLLSEKGCVVKEEVKKNITFANHNLVTDNVFGEMHLILCRNVLIYFNKILQRRVLNIFRDSLVFDGFFCLGSKESLKFSGLEKEMKVVNERARIYQKKTL